MNFQAVLSQSVVKLFNLESGITRYSSGVEPIHITGLTGENSSCIVPNAISGKLNEIIRTKSRNGYARTSETSFLQVTINEIANKGCFRLSDRHTNGILDLFSTMAGDSDQVTIRLRVKLGESNRWFHDFKIIPSDLKIDQKDGDSQVSFIFDFPDGVTKENWQSSKVQYNLKLELYVHFSKQAVINIYQKIWEPARSLNLLKNLLMDVLKSGVVCIETGDEEKVWCHRTILTSSTDYFKVMFQSGMQEATTGVIHMSDLNGDTVRALVAYLYQNEISAPLNNCAIAYQLMVAADKYEIPVLYNSMADIILHSSYDWCSVETALELHFFAKNRTEVGSGNKEIEDGLQKKAFDILRSKGRDVLDKCPAFQQAVGAEGQSGKQLCMDLLLMQKEEVNECSESENEDMEASRLNSGVDRLNVNGNDAS